MNEELTIEQIKLINIFEQRFTKLVDASSVDRVFLSTADIFATLQIVWPSEDYTVEDVTGILNYLKIESVPNDKVIWLLETR